MTQILWKEMGRVDSLAVLLYVCRWMTSSLEIHFRCMGEWKCPFISSLCETSVSFWTWHLLGFAMKLYLDGEKKKKEEKKAEYLLFKVEGSNLPKACPSKLELFFFSFFSSLIRTTESGKWYPALRWVFPASNSWDGKEAEELKFQNGAGFRVQLGCTLYSGF